MTELIARRAFPAAYIGLDLLFLVLFAGILPWKHRYLTVLVDFLQEFYISWCMMAFSTWSATPGPFRRGTAFSGWLV